MTSSHRRESLGKSDRRLDHRRVDAHLPTARDASLDCEPDDALEDGAKSLAFEQLPEADHRLGIRHLASVDAAEMAIDEVALYLPFELPVAPILQMLEHQQPNGHLGGRPAAPTSAALGEADSHRVEHPVDQLLILQQNVDATERGLHQLARVRCSKQNRGPQPLLSVSSADHGDFLITSELGRRGCIRFRFFPKDTQFFATFITLPPSYVVQ